MHVISLLDLQKSFPWCIWGWQKGEKIYGEEPQAKMKGEAGICIIVLLSTSMERKYERKYTPRFKGSLFNEEPHIY